MGFWELRLYVAGATPASQRAVLNLRRLCDRDLAGRHAIEIVDLYQRPELAGEVAVAPTLVRLSPAPVLRYVGDLSDPGLTFADA